MIEIVSYPSDPRSVKLAAIIGRSAGVAPEVEAAARDILAQVREGGDEALCALTRKFDKVEIQPEHLRMSAEALSSAADRLDPQLRASIEAAAANIRAFHERQKLNSWFMEDGDGVILGKKVTPIERVGLCVPAGEVPLFSSLLMTAIPAQVAGVDEICVVSPPVADGGVDPTIAA
ncbi:MAG TPA: histidinol dehydrogenase, partial [Candidatus Latescibacteria bacterium]|nr:histidinol dehydrogenase [Candidatus Latescibacterota bacterium]